MSAVRMPQVDSADLKLAQRSGIGVAPQAPSGNDCPQCAMRVRGPTPFTDRRKPNHE